jgi:hypothetical protein
MSRVHLIPWLAALWVCLDLVTGCGRPVGPPDSGEIRVTVLTTGPEPDPDGFRALVDGQGNHRLALTDSTLFQGLEPGVHAVELSDVAGNCAVREGGLRETTVTAGMTASVGFEVACGATAALRVTTTSEGAPADPNGYRLVVPGRGSFTVGANDAITLRGFPPGVLTLKLTDLAPSCAVPEGSARQVTLVARDTAQVTFAVHCAPPPPAYGAITVVVSTQVINTPVPDGYTITLDDTASQEVGPNDSVTFEHLVAGLHSLRLTGAPGYCLVGGFLGGANPVSVRVVGDSTSRVSFGVVCLP